VKACTKVDENLPKIIKDGYNREISLKQVSAKQAAMRVVLQVALKTKVKACVEVDDNFMLFVF